MTFTHLLYSSIGQNQSLLGEGLRNVLRKKEVETDPSNFTQRIRSTIKCNKILNFKVKAYQ